MKITNIETRRLKAALKTPFRTALRSVEFLEDIVVLIHTDTGDTGYGEGGPTPVITGETIGTMEAVIDYIKPRLIGRGIGEFDLMIETIHESILNNKTAKSALEIALYDLLAKSKKMPLYKMLGGEKTTFHTDITISLGETEEMVNNALDAILRGYRILKIKETTVPFCKQPRFLPSSASNRTANDKARGRQNAWRR